MSQISLTASMRSNLLSLQGTAKLMDQTQERLSSGKKVNSAIDNPSSYYTAQSLTNRANDLSGLLDNMGQAVSTIKAANEGIESITSFVEQAKAVATSALDTTDGKSRYEYLKQFNAIRDQIDAMANDSGYKGVNLLGGTSVQLTVTFNEGRTSSLTIQGVDGSTASTGLNIGQADWKGAALTTTGTAGSIPTGGGAVTGGAIHKDQYFASGTVLYKAAKEYAVGDTLNLADNIEMVEINGSYYDFTTTGTGSATEKIQASITAATNAITTLRNYASNFGNNYSIVQTREEFTQNLINVLEEGADKLTLADMNEESANMLALQTRQQLAINSLSLASQASQSVLRLF